jgi:hypothetical protein
VLVVEVVVVVVLVVECRLCLQRLRLRKVSKAIFLWLG